MSTLHDVELERRIQAVREFNRFWTARIGILGKSHLGTSWSLAEARVLFELGQRETSDAAELRRRLGLDAGYLSRILRRLQGGGMIATATAKDDARRRVVRLTGKGRRAFRALDQRSIEAARELLCGATDNAQRSLVAAMAIVRCALTLGEQPSLLILRPPRAGELGWMVQRHGELAAREYGWGASFEAFVARIVAAYGEKHDPRREAAWIAEVGGEPAGCVVCVKTSDRVAQLRLLLVEPAHRRRGLGSRLVDECVRFARQSGYHRLRLSTGSALHDAHRVYERAGFRRVAGKSHETFAEGVLSERWDLQLR